MATMTVTEAKQAAKKQRRKILLTIFLAVAALHVVAGITLGSIVIFQHIFKREATFSTPPAATKKLEPRKLEHKLKVNKQQQKSGRPRMQPRLSADKVADFSLPEIKSTPQKVTDPLKSNLKSFGAPGLGTGTMGGTGSGGLGLGSSQVMFFGIPSKVERVAVIVDLSPSMVHDERGGYDGFDALKQEIKELIASLNDGTFFNLITFDRRADVFKPEAVLAGKDSKKEAMAWIDPYWTNRETPLANGTIVKNYSRPRDSTPQLPTQGGLTRFDLALAAAMESNVDTIFLISDGTHNVSGPPGEEEKKAQEKRKEAYEKLSDVEKKRIQEQMEKRYADIQKAKEERASKGLAPKVEEGKGGTLKEIAFGAGHRYTDEELIAYLKKVSEELYVKKGKPAPRINTIGYVTTPQTEEFLKKLANAFQGSFKRTKTLVKPIKD